MPLTWPPRGVWTPTSILIATDERGERLSPTVRDTWTLLHALATGKDELSATFAELVMMTGKTRSTLLAHAATLRDRCGLRYHTAGDVLCVRFPSSRMRPPAPQSEISDLPALQSENSDWAESAHPEAREKQANLPESGNLEQSENSDSASLKESRILIDSKAIKDRAIRKSGKSENSDSPPITSAVEAPPATTRAITDAYVALLGFDPGTWAAGESTAAKWIAERYTVEKFQAAYRHFKAQKFFEDKRVSLRYLKQNIGDYVQYRNDHTVVAANAPTAKRVVPNQTELASLRQKMQAHRAQQGNSNDD